MAVWVGRGRRRGAAECSGGSGSHGRHGVAGAGTVWDTELNLSGKVKADRRAGEGAREWSEAEWKELARPGVPGDCGVWRGTQWSEKSDNAQKLFNHLLSMMLAGGPGKEY